MKVSVVGSGTMGRGIGQVFAQAGHQVKLIDINKEVLGKAKENIKESLARLEKKKALNESLDVIMERIENSSDIADVKGSQFIIEAVFERIDIKQEALENICKSASPDAIIGTNTSSISINTLAKFIEGKERFIGTHFFNPVPVMKLVEIITSERTSKEVIEKTEKVMIEIGKDPVFSKDFPGFISNRILMPLIREAIAVYEQGIASAADIDKSFRLGMAHPMGPLELADFVGLDVCYDVLEVLYRDYGEPRFKPPITLKNMVTAGKLGRKSGEGFYNYR